MEQSWTAERHPLWRGLLAACAIAAVIPLWCARYLPFTDLPEHVAAIAAVRHYFDDDWQIRQTFSIDLGHTSYSLYYVAGALVSLFVGSAERANLVLLSLTAVAFPYALRSLLRALGRDERLALFACPLFWNQSLLIGFFNYVAAIPVLLYLLALVIIQVREPNRRRAITIAALSVALFYLHLSAVLFFVPATLVAVMLLGEGTIKSRLRGLPKRLVYLAPLLCVGIWFVVTSAVVHPTRVGWSEPRTIEFEPLDQELGHVPSALLDIWLGQEDEMLLFGLMIAAVAIAWPAARDREQDESVRARSLTAMWLVLAAVCYFGLPQKVGWLWQLNERYAILFAVLAPTVLRPRSGWRGAVPLAFAGAMGIIAASNATLRIRAFQSEIGPFDEVLARAKPGKRVLAMVFEQRSTTARFSPFLHYGAYYRARTGGVVAPSFAELPQSPLRYRDGMRPPAQPYGWEWEPWKIRNAPEQAYFDYILVRGPDPAFVNEVSSDGSPTWSLVVRRERWALFARPF